MSLNVRTQISLAVGAVSSVAVLLCAGVFYLLPPILNSSAGDKHDIFISLLGIIIGVVTAIIIGYFVSSRISQPLRALHQQVISIDDDNDINTADIRSGNEVVEISRHVQALTADLELQNRSVKHLAFHDPLTGLCNRARFQMEVEDGIIDAANRRLHCALIHIDLDNFKSVNDLKGHEYGDRILRAVGKLIRITVDQWPNTSKGSPPILARVGGDEFTLLLKGQFDEEAMRPILQSIIKKLSAPIEVDGVFTRLSCSIGTAFYPADTFASDSLIHYADLAMCASKAAGKNTYHFYHESMNNEQDTGDDILAQFDLALNRHELELVYQPIIDIKSGAIVGAESLLRWNHPERGPLMPEQFNAIVEKNDVALPTDLWVLKKTMETIREIHLDRQAPFYLNANLYSGHLGRLQIAQSLKQETPDYAHVFKHLRIEVNEGNLDDDEQHLHGSLAKFSDMGISVWLDDYCSGHHSLRNLTTLPIDGVKINQGFASNLNTSPCNSAMLKALIRICNHMNVGLITTGIENAADLQQLQKMECKEAQGYLFSKPINKEKLLQIINDNTLLI